MTKDTADLAPVLISFCGFVLLFLRVVLVRLVIVVPVVATMLLLLRTRGSHISRHRYESRGVRGDCQELCLSVDKLLMDFHNGGSSVAPFYLINNSFVVLREPINDVLYLVFMVQWFSKESKLVKAAGEFSHVVINALVTFGVMLQLQTKLLNVAAGWSSIGCTEGFPDLVGGLGVGDE